jgi:hypothetical protein
MKTSTSSRPSIIKAAKEAWIAKLVKERTAEEAEDASHLLIALLNSDGTRTVTFNGDNCIVTGTLVESEKPVLSVAAIARIEGDKKLFDRLFPLRVIPEQRVRDLDTDALAQAIAEGIVDDTEFTMEKARKPHMRWTTKVDTTAVAIDERPGSGMHNVNKKAPKRKRL